MNRKIGQLKKTRRSFFTIMELVIVVGIIAMLAAIAVPMYSNFQEKANVSVAKQQIAMLKQAVQMFASSINVGILPDSFDELLKNVNNNPKWSGPYLERAVGLDPWGSEYVYVIPGNEGREFDIISYGRDRQPGGEGLDADISCWE